MLLEQNLVTFLSQSDFDFFMHLMEHKMFRDIRRKFITMQILYINDRYANLDII